MIKEARVSAMDMATCPGPYAAALRELFAERGIKFEPRRNPFDIHEEPIPCAPYAMTRDPMTGDLVIWQGEEAA